MVAVRKDYAAPTELEPMRMINYKDAAPTALKMPQRQLVAPKSDEGGWEALSADFADDADEEKEICAICVICGLPHSALERLFSGIHFGWTIGAIGILIPDAEAEP